MRSAILTAMHFFTPLRYPGSKRRLYAFIAQLLEVNQLDDVQYVEPCAGGASLALMLLYNEYAASIHLNDLSRPVFAFWYSVLHDTERLCDEIERTPITIDQWDRQQTVYEDRASADLFTLGFATFFLNRTNRSGIISGGVIGGKRQEGDLKLNARFNKSELIERIRRVRRYRDRIQIYQQDALAFTDDVVCSLKGNVMAFYDPPYIETGNALYLDNYSVEDHRKLAARIQGLTQPWIVTYDYDASHRHSLFPNRRCLAFSLSYSAQERHYGREAMFLSDHLQLPDGWETDAQVSMTAAGQAPIFGRLVRQPA